MRSRSTECETHRERVCERVSERVSEGVSERVNEREPERKRNKGEKWKEMFYISYAGAIITVLRFRTHLELSLFMLGVAQTKTNLC